MQNEAVVGVPQEPSGVEPVAGSDAYVRAASAVLAMPPGPVAASSLSDVLARHWGLAGRITVLSSEIEHTAEIAVPDGRRLILKTSTRPEAVASFRFQSGAIAALEGAPGVIAPRVLPTIDGALMLAENGIAAYLQTRVEGAPLHRSPQHPDLLHRTGRALADLSHALARAGDVPAMHRPVLWHIACWPRLMELHAHLPPGRVADAVADAMTGYVRTVAPRIGELDWQVTHNDPSPFNTLLTDDGIAFIDFGDGVRGPRIQDLAIAASHMVADPSRPLGGAEHVITGYSSALPLSDLEATLLVGMMKARQSALILINHWRADLFPAEAAYIKKNVARAENGLLILASLDPEAARAAVRRSAGAAN